MLFLFVFYFSVIIICSLALRSFIFFPFLLFLIIFNLFPFLQSVTSFFFRIFHQILFPRIYFLHFPFFLPFIFIFMPLILIYIFFTFLISHLSFYQGGRTCCTFFFIYFIAFLCSFASSFHSIIFPLTLSCLCSFLVSPFFSDFSIFFLSS